MKYLGIAISLVTLISCGLVKDDKNAGTTVVGNGASISGVITLSHQESLAKLAVEQTNPDSLKVYLLKGAHELDSVWSKIKDGAYPYKFSDLDSGLYSIRVEGKNLIDYVQSGIVLDSNQNLRVNITVPMGVAIEPGTLFGIIRNTPDLKFSKSLVSLPLSKNDQGSLYLEYEGKIIDSVFIGFYASEAPYQFLKLKPGIYAMHFLRADSLVDYRVDHIVLDSNQSLQLDLNLVLRNTDSTTGYLLWPHPMELNYVAPLQIVTMWYNALSPGGIWQGIQSSHPSLGYADLLLTADFGERPSLGAIYSIYRGTEGYKSTAQLAVSMSPGSNQGFAIFNRYSFICMQYKSDDSLILSMTDEDTIIADITVPMSSEIVVKRIPMKEMSNYEVVNWNRITQLNIMVKNHSDNSQSFHGKFFIQKIGVNDACDYEEAPMAQSLFIDGMNGNAFLQVGAIQEENPWSTYTRGSAIVADRFEDLRRMEHGSLEMVATLSEEDSSEGLYCLNVDSNYLEKSKSDSICITYASSDSVLLDWTGFNTGNVAGVDKHYGLSPTGNGVFSTLQIAKTDFLGGVNEGSGMVEGICFHWSQKIGNPINTNMWLKVYQLGESGCSSLEPITRTMEITN